MITTRFQDTHTRVKHGKCRELQIIKALREQAALPIFEASGDDDKVDKVDCWLKSGMNKVAIQVKYRETGQDLLFEVYDTWYDWNHKDNKLGRDMFGKAQEYAVLLSDRKTVVMIPTEVAKAAIRLMLVSAEVVWGYLRGNTFKYNAHGYTLELKVQRDPGDQRQKMIAYIPAGYFEGKKYSVSLPKNWK